MAVLGHEALKSLCFCDKPLIRNAIELKTQIQQNGIDLSLKTIETFVGRGVIDFDNNKRKLPPVVGVSKMYDENDNLYYLLFPGSYLVTFNEIVNIPNYLMARACPRSSLMRCGATMNTAVWDAGYEGQSQAMLTVTNDDGVIVYSDARIAQIVFETLDDEVENGYNGIYQREGLKEE
jgi:dUTP pyrophosphatase